jgi:excisionase family DNA binding protein
MAVLENYVDILEASRGLRVHPETLRRLCRQGDLPAVKFRNTWLIDKDKLEVFAAIYTPRRGGKRRLL